MTYAGHEVLKQAEKIKTSWCGTLLVQPQRLPRADHPILLFWKTKNNSVYFLSKTFCFVLFCFVLFSLKFCNGKLTLVLSRNARKEERLKQLRIQQALQDSEEVTLTPRINPASRHMALRLVHRAAQQDPQLLTVIQSQPEGWVLGDRPAPAHRPSTQGMHIIAEM